MAEPVQTRRSSRRRTAESATSVYIEETPAAAPADIPAAPLSRRALRESQRAAAAAPAVDAADAAPEAAPDSLVADMATAVVAATEVIVELAAEPAVPRPTRRSRVAAPKVQATTVDESAAAEPANDFPDDLLADGHADAEVQADADADAFVAASRAFSFVPAAPKIPEAEATEASRPVREVPAVHLPPRRHGVRRRFVAAGASIGVMGIAGLIAISTTLPAEAVAAVQGGQGQASMSLVAGGKETSSAVSDDEIQAYVASSDLPANVIQRAEGFSAASLIDLATQQGIAYSNEVFTNDHDAAIQWPFIVGVSMSYGYGMRDGRLHEGLDLLPGAGAPVQAIADGKVRIATESGGNYGVTVYIDHMVDGKMITSHYSHMQYGSLQVEAGQTVKVGDVIGKVGNTGRSYGAHLHFELVMDGSTIDPLPWLNENAGRYDGVSPVS